MASTDDLDQTVHNDIETGTLEQAGKRVWQWNDQESLIHMKSPKI